MTDPIGNPLLKLRGEVEGLQAQVEMLRVQMHGVIAQNVEQGKTLVSLIAATNMNCKTILSIIDEGRLIGTGAAVRNDLATVIQRFSLVLERVKGRMLKKPPPATGG